ncbi:MAG: N-6 DNA methylase [Candidatus Bathyarchaeia archaeon]
MKLFNKVVTREELNALVDKAADIIRTATDYKFILVLLFLKRISDTWREEFEEKKQELMSYLDEKSAEKEAENEVYHTFNLRRELLWNEITKDIKKLPENLSSALIKIAELNPELKGVIDKFSFLGFTTQEHRVKLMQLIELFNQYNFGNKYVSSDIVGDAYEHILYRFAPTQAKEGEVYTPREVIQLLVEILDPKPGESVYDPACGSGGMLIISHKYVREKYGKEEKLLLYGQEYNSDIYGLCRLNLIAHGITDAFIEFGDSLLYPRFTEGGRLKQFDVVIANVPWNQDGYGEETLKKADFKERYFDYPPNNTADWAWVQHMLASAKENGRVGLVVDNGCLFRSGKEKIIRSKVIEKDWVECVILTPEKLFYNTGAPGAIIIFNKNKPQERRDKILFVNASNEYIPHPSVRRLNSLSKENIEKIVKAYRGFTSIAGFSRVVDKSEIVGNDYNLNVTLYVMPVEEAEKIDISKEFSELKELEKEREEVGKRLEQYISEITKAISG